MSVDFRVLCASYPSPRSLGRRRSSVTWWPHDARRRGSRLAGTRWRRARERAIPSNPLMADARPG